ncbi:major facilitator superfamily domain-containing protein [Leptodontidium sp. MPI-SDFR-AT-0119]|nr:major facilitator superfamily domain-containing protein [Leptodontidium sp. MPI-SDFR-AT-0119]
MSHNHHSERASLLSNSSSSHNSHEERQKLANIAVKASMSILSPLASSMFAPGIEQIAESLHTTTDGVIGYQTGFVVMLGVGPLIPMPLSETFGRKPLYLVCFSIFTLLQIPTVLAKTLPVYFNMHTVERGTISDMYAPSERAGPTIGPLLGAIILDSLAWPWLFWILLMICSVAVLSAFFFLHETVLRPSNPHAAQKKKKTLEAESHTSYSYPNEDLRLLSKRQTQSIKRPLLILFTHPIVITMALYQTLLFTITYSMYTQFQSIYGNLYNFTTLQVGLTYLRPGPGFFTAVWFLVPRSVLIPLSLFTFAWTTEYQVHFMAPVTATFFYGIGQMGIFDAVQNYYIDAFERYAASAIAAGSLFRSVVGGVVPVFTGGLLESVGLGQGFSVFFGFVSLVFALSPVLFY